MVGGLSARDARWARNVGRVVVVSLPLAPMSFAMWITLTIR